MDMLMIAFRSVLKERVHELLRTSTEGKYRAPTVHACIYTQLIWVICECRLVGTTS